MSRHVDRQRLGRVGPTTEIDAPVPLRRGQVHCPACHGATSITDAGVLRAHRDPAGVDCYQRAVVSERRAESFRRAADSLDLQAEWAAYEQANRRANDAYNGGSWFCPNRCGFGTGWKQSLTRHVESCGQRVAS